MTATRERLPQLAFLGFLATVPAANWLIGNVGTTCVPNGPCLIPVAPGITAPSGVLMIGLALVLRDAVHRLLGWRVALLAIGLGTILSYAVAPPALVLASAMAFLLAELLNQAVYAPLHRRRLILAVVLSSLAGTVADSALFLWVAFGSLDYLPGQVIGKAWMVALAAFVLARARRRRAA